MQEKLIIPKEIKVGFQERKDTYSGKLAYIIYKDSKNVLRKKKSWEGWIDKKIPSEDFDNVPTEGFVINHDVGGVRNSWSSWNKRMEKVRVYDPRGFEFEITIPNMLFLLQECNSFKGKGLDGQFVYGWDQTELVLLPVTCQEYQKAVNFTEIQKAKFNQKDLKEGFLYQTKRLETVMYLGKHILFGYGQTNQGKLAHVFETMYQNKWNRYYTSKVDADNIVEQIGDSASPDYPDCLDKLSKPETSYTTHASECVLLNLSLKNSHYSHYIYQKPQTFFAKKDGRFFKLVWTRTNRDETPPYKQHNTMTVVQEYTIVDGEFKTSKLKEPIVMIDFEFSDTQGYLFGEIEIKNKLGRVFSI